jgi:3D (Asp-Asp-Asp) domain-containing protein
MKIALIAGEWADGMLLLIAKYGTIGSNARLVVEAARCHKDLKRRMSSYQKGTRGPQMIRLILLGTLTITSYRAVPEQTKPECKNRHFCETSIGENVSELGVAVSPDLLLFGKVSYREPIFIEGIGWRIVDDVMAAKNHNAIDVFVYTRAEEHAIGVRYLQVYVARKGNP